MILWVGIGIHIWAIVSIKAPDSVPYIIDEALACHHTRYRIGYKY